MKNWKIFCGLSVALAASLVALPFLRGPSVTYERSVVCNFPSDMLEGGFGEESLSNSECYIKELVDNWYYVVGDIGWFDGSTNFSEKDTAAAILSRIAEGQTALSKDYSGFCTNLIVNVIKTSGEDLKTIADSDPRGGFSISCPSEETSDAA